MSDINITVDGGTSKRLLTAGKMCDRNILITATGGGGGDLPEEAYIITGNCMWRFSSPGGNWYFEALGNQLTSKDINHLGYAFSGNHYITRIPCTLNITNCTDFQSTFSSCFELSESPKIRGSINWSYNNVGMESMLDGCRCVRNFEDLFEPSMLDGFKDYPVTGEWSSSKALRFAGCYSLREIPSWYYKFKLNENSTSYPYSGYCMYNSAFQDCKSLDEITDMPVWRCSTTQNNNMFDYAFDGASRVKNITFETDNGVPYATAWKNQYIDLTSGVGYASSDSYITGYNSGITYDKRVSDDASYQARKSDPDWWTTKAQYSRYNHDSAVATINSLPDTSAVGGGNTIKFRSTVGASTDEGAVGNLTDEEIAVAAAKGWTVTFI